MFALIVKFTIRLFVLQRDVSSFLDSITANGSVTSTDTTAVSESTVPPPRVLLSIPPPEPPIDYYENNIGGNSSGRKSSNSQQKVGFNKKSVENGTKVSLLVN